MQITILGSGSSFGVPVLGCSCFTCSSVNPRNRRLRSSIAIKLANKTMIVDTGTDFREQCLAHNIHHIDAIFYTHEHADHTHGIDDLRAFFFKHPLDIFLSPFTYQKIKEKFGYILHNPRLNKDIKIHLVEKKFKLGEYECLLLVGQHHKTWVWGLRIGSFAYITDCSYLPPSTIDLLHGVSHLVFGAISYNKTNPKHLTFEQSIPIIKKLNIPHTYFTHLSHWVEYTRDSNHLPMGINLAYDGLKINI